MSAASRRQRGNDAARWLAAWYRERGWPYAEATGSGRNGCDVTGLPGLSCEVKAIANKDMRLESWLRQAGERRGLPYVVWMPDGFGRQRPGVSRWPTIMRTEWLRKLADQAGCIHRMAWDQRAADQVSVPGWTLNESDSFSLSVLHYRGRGASQDWADWPSVLTVARHTYLLKLAGYGGEATS